MLRILLFIFKLLGIVFLSVLGLVLAVALIVLFVPIRYKVRAKKEEETWLKARAKWLFGIISIKCDYKEEKLTYSARICGKLIVSQQPKKDKKKKNKVKRKRKKKPPKKTKVIESTKKEEELLVHKTLNEAVDRSESLLKPTLKIEPELKEKVDFEPTKAKVKRKNKPKRFSKLIQRIKEKILSFFATIKNVLRKISMVKVFLKDTTNRLGFSKVWMYLKRVLKHVKPRKFVLKVKFGTGDPSSTGQLLGVIYAVYPKATKKLKIQPDFDEKRFEGELYARGRIRVFTLLVIAIKVLRDQDVKRLRENIMKLKEEL